MFRNDIPGVKHIDLDKENSRAIIAIGDIHGCAKEFEIICKTANIVYDNPIIVQLGDLIDRGPYFKEVFDVVEKYNVITLIGNHELNFSLEHRGFKKCNSVARKESHDKFNLLCTSDQEKIIEIIDKSYNAMTIVSGKTTTILSHSPIEHIDNVSSNKNAWAYCAINSPYNSEMLDKHDIIGIHGHQHWNYRSIEAQIDDKLNSFNIDGGIVYGGELVALEVTKLIPIIIKSNETYFIN